jgi:hypothetical protein
MNTCKPIWKIVSLALFFLFIGCSKDEDTVTEEPMVDNGIPVIQSQTFEVPENIGGTREVATIVATDPDNDRLTFRLESDIDLVVNQRTGAILTRTTSIFDYETATSVSFDVSVSDNKGGVAIATITINVINEDDGPLTNVQKIFVDEYMYLTYKLSPTASGGDLSEKWQGAIKLYMEGDLPDDYVATVEDYLDEFRGFMTDGTTIELVATQEESNVHLIMGPTSSVATIWPDMHELISGGNFGGYALYNTNVSYQIFKGRIWMRNPGEGLFKHEFGHIIGLGHTSDQYCENEVTSVMCSGAAAQFNALDKKIIETLYRTEIPVGLSLSAMRSLLTDYLLQGDIVF